MKRLVSLLLALVMVLSLASCALFGDDPDATTTTAATASPITVTDMIGREVTVTPGSYQRVVCIGAGALRMYSYIGDV